MPTETPKTIYLKDYTPPAFWLKTIALTFRIFDEHTEVMATQHYVRNGAHDDALVLMGQDQELITAIIDGKSVTPTKTETGITIENVPDDFTLTLTTKINPKTNTELNGLYFSGGTYCTQCEPEGFRRITYAPDRPDVMSIYTVRIEGDKTALPVLLSNGNLTDQGDLPDGWHFTVWHDPFPKPSYLFALVAGDLKYIQDKFITMSGRAVDLRIYVRDGDQSQCYHAMESLKKSMKWDEDVYGREYDLDRFNIVAVSDFNMGAMENKSLNIFNTAYVLAHPDTATDTDFSGVESVVAHEYFHNWTGNRITCRDWFQLSLKEGLTVFRDQSFSADMNSGSVCRIDDVAALRRAQFAEDASPLAHPVRPDNYIEINNFYTMTVYEKGAEVIRMMHTLLGPRKFRAATDLYFDRFDGQAVTCDDFVQCMQDASGIDLTQFKLWYSQAGTPDITAKTNYNATTHEFKLTLAQIVPDTARQTDKKPMHIPIRMALFTPNGQMIDREQVLMLTSPEQVFTFNDISGRPVPSLLRGFSAPVKLTTDLNDDDLRFLMIHDTDGFTRWDSGQTIMMGEINRLLAARMAGADMVINPVFRDAYLNILQQTEDPAADRALLARMLMLPDIGMIGQAQDIVDTDAIYAARQYLWQALGESSLHLVSALFDQIQKHATADLTPAAMTDRALKAVILKLWAEGHADGVDAAATLYKGALTMTDRVAALSVLTQTAHPERDALFADFYDRFKTFPLVIDKWFSLQAAAIRDTAIDDVKKLAQHPDFTLKNPNRARSLYGAFASGNPVMFHHTSGAGYQLMGDTIIEMNGINPQIAARLLTPFREWRRYTPDRQAFMKAQLERVLAVPDLSRDVFEIASKCVA